MSEQAESITEPNAGASAEPVSPMEDTALHERVVDALRSIFDPEIPVNIFDLGLIYAVRIDEKAEVEIAMTLTSPACPEAQNLPPMVEAEVKNVEGINGAKVEIVWDPPWGPDRMSESARLALGMDL